MLVVLTCFIVGVWLFKRRQLLKAKQLAMRYRYLNYVLRCNLDHIIIYRYDLAALPASTIQPFYPSFDDTQKSTTEEVITSLNNTDVQCPLESPPPETVPRSPTTGHTAQLSTIDGHYSSISEPSTGTVKAEGSVEEVSSAIANACTLHGIDVYICTV